MVSGEVNAAIHRGGVSAPGVGRRIEGSAQRTEKTVTLPRGRWEMQRWGYPGAPRLPQRRSEGVCPQAPWSHVLGSQHGLCELRHQLSFGTQGCGTLRVQSEVTGGLWGRGAV